MYLLVFTLLISLYIVHQLFPAPILSYFVGLLAATSLIISFKKASGLYLKTGGMFLMIGLFLFFLSDEPLHTFFLHFHSMLGLLSLFFMLPFIHSLIHVGHFDTQLNKLLTLHTTSTNQLYRKSSFVTHILGMFLNIATIPLLYTSLKPSLDSLKEQVKQHLYTRNLLRSYALCLSWSPVEVLVSVTIDATELKYYQIAPVTFGLMVIVLATDWMLFSRQSKRHPNIIQSTETNSNPRRIKRKTLQLAFMLLSFMTAVSLVDAWIGKGYLFAVVLTIIPFALLFSSVIKKRKQYIAVSVPHWKEKTRQLSNYMCLFLSAGFFVDMLLATNSMQPIQAFIVSISDDAILVYCVIGLYFLITALCGFHPLVSLALLVSMMAPVIQELPALPIAIMLIVAGTSTVMFSPFNVSVSLLADLMKVNPYRITRWNIWFASFYISMGIACATIITIIFYS
ncbi:hypothetical protein FO510_14715 [Bacillus pumilus]|uniref:hypothetical protein n=1 Tax=Bacillus pumilus TaxID=1408 RepID=UPI00017A6678|nr:hypothetical protein [Bacillus pumilus]EDW21809.1 membrane protein, putative [Bacillus pumilus ATCC 7061]MCR4354969.1 hypothetical protein [Bacillus pumilus]MCY7503898.1 hypothetical protein [Bacillus pumilus]MDR4270908.1 hypothetical protein [Bacillus pumilus]MED4628593.1 hypothetical protein [Bacillus pumilus]